MDEAFYENVRNENLKGYGTRVGRYGRRFVSKYSDKTHFVYELLQNAEDACERAKEAGISTKFFAEFRLHEDKLEMRHNGIPFDENDVRGVCGIDEGTKVNDPRQIGKFGIGFKSVYAYTCEPQIYSGRNAFRIKDYVYPYGLNGTSIGDDTVIILPFNSPDMPKNHSHSAIKKRLDGLGMRTLLFLRHIEEIRTPYSKYLKREEAISEYAKKVTLFTETSSVTAKTEEWIVFEKRILLNDVSRCLELAFLISKDEDGKKHIVPAQGTQLYAYFPTEKETSLKFIIQGPFSTTDARDNIHIDEPYNLKLIAELATLMAESIPLIKRLKLLDAEFFKVLPIDFGKFLDPPYEIFKPIYEKIRLKLRGDEPLLPSQDEGYLTATQALIAEPQELRELLSAEQLQSLLRKQDIKWLDRSLRGEILEYFKNTQHGLGVNAMTEQKLAASITEEFMRKQSDAWVIRFYDYLRSRKKLWGKQGFDPDDYTWIGEDGPFRKKPILRLSDGRHVNPFDAFGNPNAYLPGAYEIEGSPTIKREIAKNGVAQKFLQELGLREPDLIDQILKAVLPRYGRTDSIVNREENFQHIRLISDALIECQDEQRKEELKEIVAKTKLILARNCAEPKPEYIAPNNAYLGSIFTNCNELEPFFEGNENTWFVDDAYAKAFAAKTLEDIGCKAKIQIRNYGEEDIHMHGSHRWYFGNFSPNIEIDGLRHAIEHISPEKAMIIWNILLEKPDLIFGTVYYGTRSDRSGAQKLLEYSKAGSLLIKSAWLPDRGGVFRKPNELLLSELGDEFSKDHPSVKEIAEKLKFKSDARAQIIDKLPTEEQNYLRQLDGISDPEKRKRFLEQVQKLAEASKKEEEMTDKDALDSFEVQSPTTTEVAESEEQEEPLIPIQTPEETEKQVKGTKGRLGERQEDVKTERRPSIVTKHRIDDEVEADAYLDTQYGKHCQICGTRLKIGQGQFASLYCTHYVDVRKKPSWKHMEFNVIGLCPNCHHQFRHSEQNIPAEVKKFAKRVSNEASKNGIVPTEDWHGRRIYNISIRIAGEEKAIVYTQDHMNRFRGQIEKLEEVAKVVKKIGSG